jgi:hypothetical protein
MRDPNRRYADDLPQLDADLASAIEKRAALSGDAGQDRFLGEDSSLLRGLIAAMTLAGATARP